MRAAGPEPDLEQRVLGQQLPRLEPRHGLSWCGRVERMPGAVVAIAADRRLDPPAKRTRPAAHERQVLPLERTLPNERLKPRVCLLGLRDDEQARGVAVEPMHDATAFPFPTRRDADESVHERPAFVAAGRMHHEPCRFVDDE